MENNTQDKKDKDNPYSPGVNPFTNQPIQQPPPFNPPGEIKPPPAAGQADAKPEKSAPKFDLKVISLYAILLVLGVVLAKYAFDFFVPKQAGTGVAASGKSGPTPLIRFVPGKDKTADQAAQGKKTDQPLISIKKKVGHAVTPYSLSGIFFSDQKSYCIINDKVLGEGDTIDGATVTRISTDEVELQSGEKTFKINLRGK